MKFQEELISKLMTYFTVILLLGILIFEAWSLQRERGFRKEAEDTATTALDNVDNLSSLNDRLEQENESLAARLKEWEPYLSLAESAEMVALKRELFTHPVLIPQQAAQALAREIEEEKAGYGGGDAPAGEEGTDGEGTGLEFEFHKDDGEPVFFPLGTQVGGEDNCLMYTVAYEKTSGRRLGLLYEVNLEQIRREALEQETEEAAEETDARAQDGGEGLGEEEAAEEIPAGWACVAYNTGSGWNGVEEDGE